MNEVPDYLVAYLGNIPQQFWTFLIFCLNLEVFRPPMSLYIELRAVATIIIQILLSPMARS